MKRLISVIVAGVFLLAADGTAQATMDTPLVIDNLPNIVGVAGGMVPDYQGSNDYQAAPAPFFRITFLGQRYIQLLATEVNVNVLNHPILRFGPSLNYRFGRKADDIDDPVVSKMKDIDGTVEAGAFVGAVFADARNPRQRFIINLDFLHDVGSTYEGYTLTLLGRYWYPVSKQIDLTIGASVAYADEKYMQTYFGVTPDNVGTSGLPLFKASGSIKDFTVSPGMVFHLSESWHVGAGFRYQRLVNDAENSPVVKDRGSANQWVYGLALAYSW